MFFVYVLYSPAFGKHYTGFTADLEQRLLAHNQFSKKGWTVRFRPWIILHTESFSLKNEAMKREKQLKSGQGRLFIKNLIKQKILNQSSFPAFL